MLSTLTDSLIHSDTLEDSTTQPVLEPSLTWTVSFSVFLTDSVSYFLQYAIFSTVASKSADLASLSLNDPESIFVAKERIRDLVLRWSSLEQPPPPNPPPTTTQTPPVA